MLSRPVYTPCMHHLYQEQYDRRNVPTYGNGPFSTETLAIAHEHVPPAAYLQHYIDYGQ